MNSNFDKSEFSKENIGATRKKFNSFVPIRVVDLVSEARRVDKSELNAYSVLL